MERATEVASEMGRTLLSESNSLAQEVLGSMSDFKSIFGSPSEGAASVLKEQFGDLLLVDEGALVMDSGRAASKVQRAGNQEAPQGRAIEQDGRSSGREISSGNVKVDIDRDGEVRRGIVVDEDGLRTRELEIPKGNTPLDPGPERGQNPQDRFVEIDNRRPSVEEFKFDNIASETDENGEIRRVIAVDEDGLRSRELTVD